MNGCRFPIDFDHDEDGYFPSSYCDASPIDEDADDPLCEEHADGPAREGLPEFNGAFA